MARRMLETEVDRKLDVMLHLGQLHRKLKLLAQSVDDRASNRNRWFAYVRASRIIQQLRRDLMG